MVLKRPTREQVRAVADREIFPVPAMPRAMLRPEQTRKPLGNTPRSVLARGVLPARHRQVAGFQAESRLTVPRNSLPRFPARGKTTTGGPVSLPAPSRAARSPAQTISSHPTINLPPAARSPLPVPRPVRPGRPPRRELAPAEQALPLRPRPTARSPRAPNRLPAKIRTSPSPGSSVPNPRNTIPRPAPVSPTAVQTTDRNRRARRASRSRSAGA